MSMNNEIVPSALASIAPILASPFYKAYTVDPSSRGRGASQFKMLLLKRLERENAPTLASRVKKTDAREMDSFYQQYYEHYVRALRQGKLDRAQQEKIYRTTGVLFEVVCAVNRKEPQRDSFPVVMKIHSRL